MINTINEKKYSRAMVFGVFDGFHPGHEYFLKQASDKCETLFVVVTPDEIVELLKNHTPKFSFMDRMEKIKEFDSHLNVVSGDTALHEWRVIEKYKPEIIFLGHDQYSIASELEKISMPFVFLDSYQPDQYKSSLLNTKE